MVRQRKRWIEEVREERQKIERDGVRWSDDFVSFYLMLIVNRCEIPKERCP